MFENFTHTIVDHTSSVTEEMVFPHSFINLSTYRKFWRKHKNLAIPVYILFKKGSIPLMIHLLRADNDIKIYSYQNLKNFQCFFRKFIKKSDKKKLSAKITIAHA